MKVYVTVNGNGEVVVIEKGMIRVMRSLGYRVELKMLETLRNVKRVINK